MNGIFSVLRSLYKWVYHRLTGTCQLQRLALLDDKPRIQISIRCSKQLRGSLNRILSKDYDEEVFGEMCAIKRIPDNQAKQKLAVNMREIVNVYRFVDSVERIISVKYSSENDKHEEKLMEIWRNLKPYQKLEGRISTQWIEVGFQDKDPATDFRGAGVMGLYNLHHYSLTKQGMETFETASQKDTEYFFASASLYMSLLTYHLIRERRFDKLIYKFKEQPLELYQQIYQKIFTSFNKYWKKCEDKSMMKTNTNLQNFAQDLRNKTPEQLIWFLGFEVN